MTVAGVSAGLTVVSIVTVPLAALSRGVAFGTGWASTLTECAATGSLTSFSCAKGLALGAFESFAGGRIEGRISSLVEGTTLKVAPEEVGKFGHGTFEMFMHGTSAVIDQVRK